MILYNWDAPDSSSKLCKTIPPQKKKLVFAVFDKIDFSIEWNYPILKKKRSPPVQYPGLTYLDFFLTFSDGFALTQKVNFPTRFFEKRHHNNKMTEQNDEDRLTFF